MASGFSNGAGGLITNDAAMQRYLDRLERKAQAADMEEAIHLYHLGQLSYAELKRRHAGFMRNTKRVAS